MQLPYAEATGVEPASVLPLAVFKTVCYANCRASMCPGLKSIVSKITVLGYGHSLQGVCCYFCKNAMGKRFELLNQISPIKWLATIRLKPLSQPTNIITS